MFTDNTGQGLVEYALLFVIIVAVVALAAGAIATASSNKLNEAAADISGS